MENNKYYIEVKKMGGGYLAEVGAEAEAEDIPEVDPQDPEDGPEDPEEEKIPE